MGFKWDAVRGLTLCSLVWIAIATHPLLTARMMPRLGVEDEDESDAVRAGFQHAASLLVGALLGVALLAREMSRRLRHKTYAGDTALVTGASYGIGFELAKRLAADGHHLVLVARHESRLKDAAAALRAVNGDIDVRVVAMDLGVPGAADALVRQLKGRHIDVLVNNAGFGHLGEFASMEPSMVTSMCALNVGTLAELTRAVLPAMVDKGRGRVLNVASTAAFQPGPHMAVYYASKAFVHSFSRAVAYELRNSGVTVTSLCPGPVHTEFGERSGNGNTILFKVMGALQAVDVANAGYDACMRGDRTCVVGPMDALLALLPGVVPDWLVLPLSRMVLVKVA